MALYLYLYLQVTMDNYAVFSVRHDCVKQKMTTFEIPAKMPKCSSPNGCICGWRECTE